MNVPGPNTLPEGFARAHLLTEDGTQIECWFNPTTLEFNRGARYASGEPIGQVAPPLEYVGGTPEALSLNLVLHAADDRTAADVRTALDSIEALLEPTAGDDDRPRPPTVQFVWGRYVSFVAVCESISTTIELFEAGGDPLRALVAIRLVQFEPDPGQGDPGGQNPTTRATQRRHSHLVVAGDSLPSIAYRYYGDPTRWRRIARVNHIDDPLRLPVGGYLTVPLEAR